MARNTHVHMSEWLFDDTTLESNRYNLRVQAVAALAGETKDENHLQFTVTKPQK